jgi:hypothetical protein
VATSARRHHRERVAEYTGRAIYSVLWCDHCDYGSVSNIPDPETIASFYLADYYTIADEPHHEKPRFVDRLLLHLSWRLDYGVELAPDQFLKALVVCSTLDVAPAMCCSSSAMTVTTPSGRNAGLGGRCGSSQDKKLHLWAAGIEGESRDHGYVDQRGRHSAHGCVTQQFPIQSARYGRHVLFYVYDTGHLQILLFPASAYDRYNRGGGGDRKYHAAVTSHAIRFVNLEIYS